MPETAFNPALHAAQFQLFMTFVDINPDSEGYGDFLWFGLPLYDFRHRDVPAYKAADAGKDDATGKYIYMLSSSDVLKGLSMHDKQWVSVKQDVYADLAGSFREAQEKGYLARSALEDMAITSLNIGWENAGTINSSVVMKGLDIQAVMRPEM